MKILITGATGTVGHAVIAALLRDVPADQIIAGVRNVKKIVPETDGTGLLYRHFDFEDTSSFDRAFAGVDFLFLLRPPHLTEVKRYFNPLIEAAVKQNVKHVVFLSVQGAEDNSFIPHHKIEKLILQSGIPYTFLRPAYFYQNFMTSHLQDIKERREIFLPAGKACFTLVDAEDIGYAAAEVLRKPHLHINRSYDLTAEEALTFAEMATKLSIVLGTKVRYRSAGLLAFYWRKKQQGTAPGLILVMIMLHFLPRLKKTPPFSSAFEELTGRKPRTFENFAETYKHVFA